MAKKILVTVIVLSAFRDKFDHKTQYPAGMELQVDEKRAKDLVSRGLARLKESESEEPEQPQPAKPEAVPESPDSPIAPADSNNPEKKEEDECQRTEKQ
ncbi:hypothetical protein [Bacteroides gallinarum]|uniref:hypothetical protein n=1 Tax=Bacteroides gallinarum TaxID=376806 RepID=UPI0003738446|nr:hypothetical protein [Bacteroides gallinarum]